MKMMSKTSQMLLFCLACIMVILLPVSEMKVKAASYVDYDLFLKRFNEDIRVRYKQGEYWEGTDDGTGHSSPIGHAMPEHWNNKGDGWGACPYYDCEWTCNAGAFYWNYNGQPGKAITCNGFARMIQSVIFQKNPGEAIYIDDITSNEILPGDVLVLGTGHTVLVWDVKEFGNGDALMEYADANQKEPNRISYDYSLARAIILTRSWLDNESGGFFVWRMPNAKMPANDYVTGETVQYVGIPQGGYYIKNLGTGKYLQLDGGIDESMRNICVGMEKQEMVIQSDYEGLLGMVNHTYTIRPAKSASRIINPNCVGVADVDDLNLFDNSTGDLSQRWQFQKVNGGYVIRNVQNPYCVIDNNGENAYVHRFLHIDVDNNYQVDMSKINKNQIWVLESVSDSGESGNTGDEENNDPVFENITEGKYYFKNLGTGKYLDLSSSIDEEQRNIGVYTYHGDANQVMNVIADSQGFIIRPDCSASRIMNPFAVELVDGANVNLLTNYAGDATQRWKFEKVDGGYVIRNLANINFVLDNDGTNAYIYHYMQGNKNQIWALEKKIDVTGVSLNTTSVSMEIGSNKTLSATISPSNATYKSKTWTSNNSTVATVDSNGKVKAVGIGTAKITCQVDGYKAECTVNVVGHPLTGQIRLDGEPKFGETLMVVVTNSNNTGTKYYQWQRDGVDVAGRNATLYPLAQEDIGKNITCVVTSSVETGKLTASVNISKADGPAAPEGISATAPSEKGKADGKIGGVTSAMEYAHDENFSNKTVCTGTEITGLAAGTYYVRYAETETHKAGAAVAITVPEGKAALDASAPKLNSVTVSNGIVTFTWTANEGVDQYAVFRKTDSGSWKKIGVTSETSYADSTVEEGHAYCYTARGIDEEGKYITSFDTVGKSVTITAAVDASAPVVLSATSGANGVTVKWKANSAVTRYAVFRKTDSGKWTKLAEVSGTSYLDGTVAEGHTYAYTVRGIDAAGKYITSFDATGKSVTITAAVDTSVPVVLSATSGANGVTVKWKANTGVTRYAVFRKTGSGKWTKLAEVNGTSYLDGTASEGYTYAYTVRGIDAAGKYITSFDATGKSVTVTAAVDTSAPVILSVASGANGVTVTWKANSGVTKYAVFRKTDSGKWTKVGESSGTSYLDSSVTEGTYTYTVRGLDASGKYMTSYNTTGVSVTVAAQEVLDKSAPALVGANSSSVGIVLTWIANSGVDKYAIFRKTTGSWTKIDVATGASAGSICNYIDQTAVAGTTYTYTVRGIDANGKYITSFDATGISCTK